MLSEVRPRIDQVLGLSAYGFHRIALAEWGDGTDGRVCLCVHGLTRTGRDFDALAGALAAHRRVLCPDLVGRGRSDWLPAAEAYGYPQYNADMTAVIARAGVPAIDWVGTSMGGLIGMMLAAQPQSPIRRMVVNDVGPLVPAAALRRLADYVGTDPRFAGFEEAVTYVREVHAPFGDLSEAQWCHLAEHAVRPDPEGGYRLAYDPAIAAPLADRDAIEDIDLWAVWDAIRCPVLLLRGAESDLLPPEVAREMTRRGPPTDLVEIAGVGHAPALMAPDQVGLVVDWLTRTDEP